MISVLLAMFGMTIYSTGVILQKKGSHWMIWKGKRGKGFFIMLCVWLVGILLSYTISALPVGVASKDLPPHIISALSGWSIVVVILLSCLFLKEKLHISDMFYSLLILASTFCMGILQETAEQYTINRSCIPVLLFIPFLLLIPLFLKSTENRYKVILLSVFSGILGSMTIVFMNILVKECGNSISGVLSSAYIYVYFFSGIASVIAAQAAYRMGDVILIAPLKTSFSIIYPVISSYFLLDSGITVIQMLLILSIMISCWGILTKHSKKSPTSKLPYSPK